MYNRKSIYALNKKDLKAVVYTEKNERRVRVTADELPADCNFEGLKKWSDTDYHAEENQDHVEKNHTVSIETISPEDIKAEDPETLLIRSKERDEEVKAALQKVAIIRACLSETQFRRLWRYYVMGFSEVEIAAKEGSTQQAISKSIKGALKKIKKIFPDS